MGIRRCVSLYFSGASHRIAQSEITDLMPYRHNIFVAVSIFLLLAVTAVALHFNGLYGQDAYEYLRLSRAINALLNEGTGIPHSYFPILYPFAGFLLNKVLAHDILSMQVVSITALTAAFFYLRQLIRQMHGATHGLTAYLFAFFIFSPYVFRFGLLSMSDMLCLLFVVASVCHCVRYIQLPRNVEAVLFALYATAAVATRYAVLPLLIVSAMLLLAKLLYSKKWLTLGMMMLTAGCVLVPDAFLRGRILFFQVQHAELFIDYASNAYQWSFLNFFRSGFDNPDGLQQYAQWNLATVTFQFIHPAFIFAGLLFIFFLQRNDFNTPATKLLLLMVAVYAFYLAGLQYQNNRYLLQSFPLVVALYYPAFSRIAMKYARQRVFQWSFFAVVLFIQLIFFGYSFRSIVAMNRAEKAIANSLKDYPGQPVYTCSITGALAAYEVENHVTDLYFEVIGRADTNALVLFNPSAFTEHFAGKNPMINWEWLNRRYVLTPVRTLPDGWYLYSIKDPAIVH